HNDVPVPGTRASSAQSRALASPVSPVRLAPRSRGCSRGDRPHARDPPRRSGRRKDRRHCGSLAVPDNLRIKHMSVFTSLGYVVVRGSLEEWARFATKTIGAQPEPSAAGELRLRLDEYAYR